MTSSPNVIRHNAIVTRERREILTGHKSVNIWFTGLSGSGKSTLAHAVEERLHLQGKITYVFDGDNVRHGLCNDLGFTMEERSENLRRIAEMTKLFLDAGVITLAAFISPLAEDRARIRKHIAPNDFIEVYCNCSIEICEQRDVKGLYKKAREGIIKNYTGISSPYEPPVNSEIELNTGVQPLMECVDIVMDALYARGIISGSCGQP